MAVRQVNRQSTWTDEINQLQRIRKSWNFATLEVHLWFQDGKIKFPIVLKFHKFIHLMACYNVHIFKVSYITWWLCQVLINLRNTTEYWTPQNKCKQTIHLLTLFVAKVVQLRFVIQETKDLNTYIVEYQTPHSSLSSHIILTTFYYQS